MNIRKIGTTALVGLCLALPSLAEDKPSSPSKEKSPDVYGRGVKAKAQPRDSQATTPATSEVFQNVVLEAGKGAVLDSALDYSLATTVAVAVQCDSCVTSALSLASAGLSLQASWTVPDADLYTSTESKSAATFPYWDAGGVLFNVYGPKFQLILQNSGAVALSISQITLFRR